MYSPISLVAMDITSISPLYVLYAVVAAFAAFCAWVGAGRTAKARTWKRWVKKEVFGVTRNTRKYEGKPGDGSNLKQARNG